jgi:hypothetical protein
VELAVSLPNFDKVSTLPKFGLLDYAGEFLKRSEISPPYFPFNLEFDAKPLRAPLLPTNSSSSTKLALDAFNQILAYIGRAPNKKPVPKSAKKLLKLAVDHPTIRDEVYCQLTKQTSKNKEPESAARAWELFLIIASGIPASARAEKDVRIHLAQETRSKQSQIADIAQFTFIRFSARCALGQTVATVSTAWITKVPKDLSCSALIFGSSIYEQLWAQKSVRPRLPIPYILYFLVKTVLERGAERTEGIFRRSGNVKRLQDMIAALNRGGEIAGVFGRADIHDLAQLIKQWFTSLPEKVVDGRLVEKLATVYEGGKNYGEFVGNLPEAHLNVLKFLYGFLKHMIGFEGITKMDLRNLAIVFAPAVVAQLPAVDQFTVVRHTVVSQEFFVAMLHNCETEGFYPLPEDLAQ